MSVAVQPQIMVNERHNSYDWAMNEPVRVPLSQRPRCATDALSRSPYFGSTGCLVSESESAPLKESFSLLSAEFYELKERTEQVIHCIKLYLTDKELIVARVDGINGKKPRLLYLRTHSVSEIEVELDQSDSSTMRIRDLRHGARLYIYRLRRRNGQHSLRQWISRLNCVSSSSSSSLGAPDNRRDLAVDASVSNVSVFQVGSPGRSSPITRRLLSPSVRPREWHGETFAEIAPIISSPSPDLEEPVGISEVQSAPQVALNGETPKHQFSSLEVLQQRERLRSHSCPPSEDSVHPSPTAAASKPTNEQPSDLASPTAPGPRTFMSPTRHSTIRKNRLKFSPRVPKSVTKAFSGHFTSLSSTESTPVKSTKNLLKRSSQHSATLPRSRNKQRVRKWKESRDEESRSEGIASTPQTPVPPTTPIKLKSPGSILKIIRGRWNSSMGIKTVNLEETWAPFDETDRGSPLPDTLSLPRNTKLFMLKPKDVAEELTLIDAEMFQSIDPSEIKNAAWTKSTKHTESPNIMRMIDWFNRLARIACTEIIQEKTVQARAKAISCYIKIASKCYRMHNYNSLKALLSALQLQAVYRLQKSWNHVPRKRKMKFDQLAKVMSEENRFENLRREMQANVASGILFVPYLAWFLNSVITNDTLFEVRRDRELGFKSNRFASASVSSPSHEVIRRTRSGKAMSWRDSTCSVSLPSSPAHSVNSRKLMDEKALKRGVVLSKSENDLLESSDSSLGLAISGGSSSQLVITRSHSTQIMASFASSHPVVTSTVTEPAISSESSIDEHSPKTDSAVVLESLGHLSPVQQQHDALGSASSCTTSLPCRPRTNSILSYSDDYVLPEVEVSFEDSDADDERDFVFENSFTNHLATASLPPVNFGNTEEAAPLEASGLVEDATPNGNPAPISSVTSIVSKHVVSENDLSSHPGRNMSARRGVMRSTLPCLLTNLTSIAVSQEFVREKDRDRQDVAFSGGLHGFASYSQQCGILLSSVIPASSRKHTSMSETSCSNEIINCLPLTPKTKPLPSSENGGKDQLEEEEAKDDKRSGPTSSSSSDAEQETSASLSFLSEKTIPSSGCQEHCATSPVADAPLRHNPAILHELKLSHNQYMPITTLERYQRVTLQHSEHLSKRHRLSTLLKSMTWLSENECLEISKQIEPNNHSL